MKDVLIVFLQILLFITNAYVGYRYWNSFKSTVGVLENLGLCILFSFTLAMYNAVCNL